MKRGMRGLALGAAMTLMLTACGPSGTGTGTGTGAGTPTEGPHIPNADISAIVFSQSQAVAGFDTSEYRQDGRADLDKFIAELELYGVIASDYVAATGPPCAGGLSTLATIEYSSTKVTTTMQLDSCTSDDGFTEAADTLFTEWRIALSS